MKKIYQPLCILPLLATTITAQAHTLDAQMGVKVGSILHNRLNDEFGHSGLRISEVNKYGIFYNQKMPHGLGIELDLMFNDDANVNGNNIKAFTLESYQFDSFVSLDLPFNDAGYLRLKAGYNRNYFSIKDAKNESFNNDSGFIFGAGAGLNVSRNMGILTEYTHSFAGEKSNCLLAGLYFRL